MAEVLAAEFSGNRQGQAPGADPSYRKRIPLILNSGSVIENWCFQNGYTDISLELDSLMIINLLNKKIITNLKLKQIIEKTIKMLEKINASVNHILREDNQVADCLAKLALATGQAQVFQQLRRNAKGPYRLAKMAAT
ncbi:hypothetical protein HAX54_030944 [Datura stramonium]|uniref:RNase H type-1 domain-containing protein n=1 Tax=Datura stramonium TaxID=4076 RepID=A0ABS8SBM0_DATST|nr:hypothetical protein [Datura stramonium]